MSISTIEAPDTTSGGVRLRLQFERRTAITSLQELSPAVERWNSILSAFSLVSRGTPGTRLVDIRGHAPLVIDLAVHATVLAALQMGVSGCLKALGELTALAEKIEEIRRLNVRDEILKALEEQLRDNRDATTAKTTEEIAAHFGCDDDTRNGLHKALITLAKFIQDGGKIEFANAVASSEVDVSQLSPSTLRAEVNAV